MFEFGGRMARFPSGIHRPGLAAVWLRLVRKVLGRLATVRAGEAWGGGSRELRSGQGGPCGSAGSVPHRRILGLALVVVEAFPLYALYQETTSSPYPTF